MTNSASFIFAAAILTTGAFAQTNTFPASGNVGIGTTAPATRLDIKPNGSIPAWIGLDKNPGMEAGIRFLKGGPVLFYFYSDNDENDALKIQSTAVSGENDGSPRLQIPYNNKDLYLTTSGGNVAIGHKDPAYRLDVLAPADTWKARFQGPDGYITIGPANPTWAHIYTDRPNFIFNQNVWTLTGGFSSYENTDLSLQTHGIARLTISRATGNVGVGTSTPGERLHVSGGAIALDEGQPLRGGGRWLISGGSSQVTVGTTNSGIGLQFDAGAAARMFINGTTGNVGIGTPSPTEKLTVHGTIYGKEVRVDLSVPGPDYVFEKEYDLPSLEAVKAYVEMYKHLPDVPSAREMEEKGINVGEMNMILLRKIEEMTLYMIELKKENEEIKKQLANTK